MSSSLAPCKIRASRRYRGRRRVHQPALEPLEARALLSGAGSLDTTFGSGGIVINNLDGINGAAQQSDGKIVGYGVGHLVRYSSNDTLDTTFGPGGTGIVTTAIGYHGYSGTAINSLVVQGDGKIVAVGQAENPNSPALADEWALARYDTLGNLDSTFGSGGIVTSSFDTNGRDTAQSAALQSNGQIVVAGIYNANSGTPQFEVGRYNADGSLDTAFGSGGVTTTAAGSGAQALDVVIQADGNIVTAGYAAINGKDDIMLARYLGSATAPAAVAMRAGAEPVPSAPQEASIGALTNAAPAASAGIGPIDPLLLAPTGPLALPGLTTWWRPKVRAMMS